MTMALETFPFDAADHISSPEAAAAFLADALESGDVRVVADAIEVLERASERRLFDFKARRTGQTKVPAANRPSFEAVMTMLDGLGVKLTPVAVQAS